jgi:uncharacterized protein involved in exopolysaccharide biosynthesis
VREEVVPMRESAQTVETSVAHLRVVWEQRRLLTRIALYSLLASTLFAFLLPKQYESVARLMPPDQQSGTAMATMGALASKLGGLGAVGSGLIDLKSPGELFVGVLQSRTVQEDLIARFELRKTYGVRYLEDARKVLAQHTDLSEDRKSGIITIKVNDKDPHRAASMCEEYVAELNQLINQLTTSSAHRERLFLEERLDEVKHELGNAEDDFSQFASKNAAINIPEQGKAMMQAAATLQGQLIAAESELEGLRQIYTDNNVRVRAMEARVSELRRQLGKLGGKPGNEEKSGGDSFYPSIRKLPLLGVAYTDLYRQEKIEEAVFETLTQEYELAKVEEAKEIPVVKVLDPANVPERKSFPPRLLIMVLGTLLGLALGVTWVFGKAMWQETDSADPRKVFAQEVSSTVSASLPKFLQNGSRGVGIVGKLWSLRSRREEESVAVTQRGEAEVQK